MDLKEINVNTRNSAQDMDYWRTSVNSPFSISHGVRYVICVLPESRGIRIATDKLCI